MTARSPKSECTSQCGATGPRYTTRTWPLGGSLTSGSALAMDMRLRPYRFVGHGLTSALPPVFLATSRDLDSSWNQTPLGPVDTSDRRSDGIRVDATGSVPRDPAGGVLPERRC